MQQPIAARRVCRNRKRISGGIGELDVGILVDAQVAACRRFAVECGRQHAVLDRHALRAPVQKHVESLAVPRRRQLSQLDGGQFDRCDDSTGAKLKHLGRGMSVEDIERIIRDDVAALPAQLGHESEMTAEYRETQVEPLLKAGSFPRTNDRRRAKSERHAAFAQTILKCAHARARRRRMPDKWIETNLRRARVGRGFRVVEIANLRGQRKYRSSVIGREALVSGVHGGNFALDASASLSQLCGAGPVRAEHELRNRVLAQLILRTLGEEQSGRQRDHLHVPKDERRVPEAAELLAERGGVQRALAGVGQRHRCTHCDRLAVSGEHRLKRCTSRAEQANIEARFPSGGFGRERRVTRAGALAQTSFRRANDAPSGVDPHPSLDRLPHAGARGKRTNGFDTKTGCWSPDVGGRLEPKPVAYLDRRRHVDDQLIAFVAHDGADDRAVVARLGARNVMPARPPAVHAAGESAAIDLHEWFYLVL